MKHSNISTGRSNGIGGGTSSDRGGTVRTCSQGTEHSAAARASNVRPWGIAQLPLCFSCLLSSPFSSISPCKLFWPILRIKFSLFLLFELPKVSSLEADWYTFLVKLPNHLSLRDMPESAMFQNADLLILFILKILAGIFFFFFTGITFLHPLKLFDEEKNKVKYC